MQNVSRKNFATLIGHTKSRKLYSRLNLHILVIERVVQTFYGTPYHDLNFYSTNSFLWGIGSQHR